MMNRRKKLLKVALPLKTTRISPEKIDSPLLSVGLASLVGAEAHSRLRRYLDRILGQTDL